MLYDIICIMICPKCRGELIWDITKRVGNRVEEAKIRCASCKEEYNVHDGIGEFIKECNESKGVDNFLDNRSSLLNISEETKKALLEASLNSLNASDLSFYADLMRERGKVKTAAKVKILERNKKFSKEYYNIIEKQFENVSNLIKDDGYILDIATGRGSFLKHLLEKHDNHIVGSDISLTGLSDLKKELIAMGKYDRVSLFAFNGKAIPFRDNSFNIATSFYGIGHITNVELFIREVTRIIQNKFLSIENLYFEDGSENTRRIYELGWEDKFENKLVPNIEKLGLDVNIENPHIVKINPTPVSEYVKIPVNSLPVVETEVKSCTIIIKKK